MIERLEVRVVRAVRLWVLVTLIFLAIPACGGELVGRVVGVADGDTLTLLTDAKQKERIRLAEIDAPEKRQPYGAKSKESLAGMCFGKDALVRVVSRDAYGRVVGRVLCDGIDANLEQVRRGMAWVYVRYSTDAELRRAEEEALAARRGLWAESNPVPPWEWRKRRR